VKTNRCGVTLLEIVVAMALVGIVAAMSVVVTRPARSRSAEEGPRQRCRRQAVERAKEVTVTVGSILIRCLPDGTLIEPEGGGKGQP